ncbi:hypothetical protein NDU88_010483 [Pleurodeles waltl]|uniref:Uncharacterized protein n=1 Tax=Pleurodeles waltl TaxID=8319 RepID=A0AAV7RYD2_PLEWA|nr:hypothetical protein NDU88_010483 [Pleurodeles waltl]
MRIPDPEVLRAGTNLLTLLGDGGQQQPLRATTRIETAEGGDSEERSEYEEEERKTETGKNSSDANPGGGEFGERGSGGRNSRSRLEETFPRGEHGRPQDHLQHQGRYRGPGGSAPKLRPRSGESVASAGAWTGLTCRGGDGRKGDDTVRLYAK